MGRHVNQQVIKLFLLIIVFASGIARAVDWSDLPTEEGALLTPYIDVLYDPQEQFSVEWLFTNPQDYHFLTDNKGLTFGFYKGAVWLRFELYSSFSKSLILNVSPSFLDQITLYQLSPGRAIEVQYSGDHVPANQRVIKSRNMLLPVSLSPGNNQFLLRIESSSALFALPELWQPQALTLHLQKVDLFYGVMIGLSLLGIVVSLLCWIWFRQQLFVIATLFILAITMLNITLKGFDQIYLYPDSGYWPDQMIGVWAFALGALILQLFSHYLNITRHIPTLAFIMSILQWIWWGCSLVCLFGFYHYLTLFIHSFSMVILFSVVVLAFMMLEKERSNALLLLMTFVPSQIALFILVLVNMGILPSGTWALHLHPITSMQQVIFTILVVLIKLRNDERETQQEKQQSQAIKQFYAMMAHELRTPLAVIGSAITNLQLMAKNIDNKEQARFDRINSALARLNFLLDNALVENRLEQSEQNMPLARLNLNHFIATIKPLLPVSKLHPLTIQAPNYDVTFDGNEEWLKLALLNLVDNAIKYSPDGGDIKLCVNVHGKLLRFSLSDQGIGVTDTDRSLLFKKHRRGQAVQTRFNGVGLGLHLVAMVAKRHHGKAGYLPQAQGSCFYVEIPAHDSTQ